MMLNNTKVFGGITFIQICLLVVFFCLFLLFKACFIELSFKFFSLCKKDTERRDTSDVGEKALIERKTKERKSIRRLQGRKR